jgi:hypothetical protein
MIPDPGRTIGAGTTFRQTRRNQKEDSTGQAAQARETTMTLKTKFSMKGTGRDSYLKLVTAFPLASIKSDEQLQEAQKVMDQLLALGELKGGE